MTGAAWIIAQTSGSRTFYELTRLRSLDQWWHWLVALLVCGIVLAVVTWMYRMDSRELPRGKRWVLLVLRVFAFVGLLIFFLGLQKRTERRVVKNSRAVLLVDTSQSMGLSDDQTGSGSAGPARIDQVVAELASGSFLQELQAKHDVSIFRFDENSAPTQVAAFPKVRTNDEPRQAGDGLTAKQVAAVAEVRTLWTIGASFLGLAAIGLIVHLVLGNLVRGVDGSWALLLSVLALIVAGVFGAVANLRNPSVSPRMALGWESPATIDELPADETPPSVETTEGDGSGETPPDKVDWKSLLAARGTETRLGDALQWVIDRERGGPIAGIAVVTDGNSNRGIDYTVAMDAAKASGIPVFSVGIGSDRRPVNVRVVDLEAPPRVYPGDQFSLTGFLQSYGLKGRRVQVQLFSQPEEGADEQFLEEELTVPLAADGEVLPVQMQVTPEQTGRRVYTLRVVANVPDQDDRDNESTAKVQIVDRKNRVLLVAGGPTREYRFVRNMLYRDKDSTVDVLLQTGETGISQEADDILFDFPREANEMFDYDCLIAFDPDWNQLDRQQVDLLERWVAEKAGGLICIAGPVYTAEWAENRRAGPQAEVLKQLYPVTFYSLSAARVQLGRFGSATAWPLELTEDGRQAPFLSLRDEGDELGDVWSQFEGVYSYYAVKDPKPGATVYARFSDPQTAIDDQLPIYIAGQFYGAGRVLFMGSGEMWRLRGVDNVYFERFYTKLVRFASQGRLLRDSNRGMLLVDKERGLLGDSIAVRASLFDEQYRPMTAPEVTATLVSPDQGRRDMKLMRSKGEREGMYAGQFMATQEGDYHIELTLPASGEEVVLRRDVRVRIPNLEIERPQRNEPLLSDLATSTRGSYYVGMAAAAGRERIPSLASRLSNMDRETFLPGTPDRPFERQLMSWLLALICGALCLEWLVRRLNKLA